MSNLRTDEDYSNEFNPVFSPRHVIAKLQKKEYVKHRKAIAKVKAMVDTKPPICIVKDKLRQEVFKVESNALWDLDAENERLMKRIAERLLNPSKIDCWNMNIAQLDAQNRYKKGVARKELLRSTKENNEILKRIVHAKSVYPRQGFLENWEKHQIASEGFADYQHVWKDPYFTPAILYVDNLRPRNTDELRFPKFKDVEQTDFSCCHKKKLTKVDLGRTPCMLKRLEENPDINLDRCNMLWR